MDISNYCIFCGAIADTREHIPAKNLFKGTPDKDLITVPSCNNCNAGYQQDEELFRHFFASILSDRSNRAKEILENEITRSIKRKPALAKKMFSQMKLIDAYTKSGIYTGQLTMYRLSDEDIARINRVVRKITQGLFFNQFKQILPKDWTVKIIWIRPKIWEALNLSQTEKMLAWNIIKEDTFAFGMNSVPNTYQSMWMLDFFKVPLFYVLVLDKNTAKGNFTNTPIAESPVPTDRDK